MEAVESGSWNARVFPICEKFPVTREEFRGAWEDRFDYDYVLSAYKEESLNKGSFWQELMLRISNEEDRLIYDEDIKWYKRSTDIIMNKHHYNWYITTDPAVTKSTAADDSVISLWAVDRNSNIYWVNGWMEQETIDKFLDALFGFVTMFSPYEVGLERSGQQNAIITMVLKEMERRGKYFNIGKDPGSKQYGFYSGVDKLMRFMPVVPMFKSGRIFFPEDMKDSKILRQGIHEITSVSTTGIKSKRDNFLDTVSMLAKLNIIAHSGEEIREKKDTNNGSRYGVYDDDELDEEVLNTKLSPYIN